MPTSESLTEFYQTYLQADFPAPPPQFNVFAIEAGASGRALPFSRRDFYKITLYTSGTSRLYAGGEPRDYAGPALVLYNPLAPYSCEAVTPISGFFCLFTAEFLHGTGASTLLQESPLFQLTTDPVLLLSAAQSARLSQLFQEMLAEMASDYRYKFDLLRTQVQLLLHEALRLQPPPRPPAPPTAASRLAAQFVQVLEQQFPVQSPALPLRLSTAEAFAAHLNVHINHLSRVLREVTGRPTSTHVAGRIAQEAKALLLHTDWPIADVADSLAFADPTYFNHFFRKHAGTSPKAFRQQALLAAGRQ